MKTFKNLNIWIAVVLVTTLFAACKSKTETRDIQLLTDSTAYNSYADTMMTPAADAPAIETPAKPARTARQSPVADNNNNNGNTSTANNDNNAGTSQTQKKGWSKAAQGAVIGGAAGAVGGAIISKKKGKGAVIGAAAGAVGGYIIGREKDKKDGRVKDNN